VELECNLAAIARVRVSLRVFGDGLEPDEVSALLGREPTRCHRKGDKTFKTSSSSGASGSVTSIEPTGAWILDSGLSEKAEIEDHVEALLSPVSNDSDEWASLTSRFSASILCSVFLDQYNEGFELSPRLAQSLADRGLVIAFDIYSGDSEA
jgi:hypothetical protein